MKRQIICLSLILSFVLYDFVDAKKKDKTGQTILKALLMTHLMPQRMPFPIPVPIPIRIEREHHHKGHCHAQPSPHQQQMQPYQTQPFHLHHETEFVPIFMERDPVVNTEVVKKSKQVDKDSTLDSMGGDDDNNPY